MDETPAKRRPTLKRLLLWGVPALVVAITAIHTWQWHRALLDWERAVHRIEDRGEPVQFADLVVEIDSPDDDAGPLLLKAIHALQEPDAAYIQLIAAEPPTRAGTHAALRDALRANQKSLDFVVQASERPHCRFSADAYLFDQRRMEILKCRELGDLLRAQVLWSLGTGDEPAALAAVIQGFQLAELVGEESLAASRFTAIAIQNKSLRALEELLSNMDVGSEGFAELDTQVRRAEQRCRCETLLQANRVALLDGTGFLTLRESIGLPGAPQWVVSGKRWLYEPWVTDNVVYWIQALTELAAIADSPGLENAEIQDWSRRVGESKYSLAQPYLIAARQLREPILTMRQQLILARWGLRVDRYYRQHGRFPAALSLVADDELPAVAPDSLFEQPLSYETYPGGFVVRIADQEHADAEFLRDCRFEVSYSGTGDLQDAADVSTQE